MSQGNTPSNPAGTANPDKKANPVHGWIVLIAIVLGVWWVYDRNEQREAQRRREIMREVNWVVTPDGVRMYKTDPNQNVNQRLKEIDEKYRRPVWEDVPEDRRGKGKIIIQPQTAIDSLDKGYTLWCCLLSSLIKTRCAARTQSRPQ
jgi:hypothetical protein